MVTMSQKEFQRVKVIENAASGRLSVREASRLLQLSERQVQRAQTPLSARFGPSADSAAAPGRTRRAPSQAPDLGPETKNPDTAYLQSLRPPRFGGRYLIDRGCQSLVAVNTTFSRCNNRREEPPPHGCAVFPLRQCLPHTLHATRYPGDGERPVGSRLDHLRTVRP